MIEPREFNNFMKDFNKPKLNSLKRVFMDAHLGNGHAGLENLANKEKESLVKLSPGEFAIFINKKKTALKMVTAYGTTIAHFKMPKDHRLDLRAIKYLPTFFSGRELNYLGALREVFK